MILFSVLDKALALIPGNGAKRAVGILAFILGAVTPPGVAVNLLGSAVELQPLLVGIGMSYGGAGVVHGFIKTKLGK